MKKIKYAQLIIITLIIMIFVSCEKELTPQEEKLMALKNNGKTWVLAVNGVGKDGYNVKDQFTGFQLSIL